MKTRKNNFNLVEIIISMGIVVICITTIMGMFSFGMDLSQDAVMKSYSNNIIAQLGGMVETHPDAQDSVPTDEPTDAEVATMEANIDDSDPQNAIDPDDSFFKNVYWDGTTMGTVKIVYKTTIDSVDAVDFTAYAKIWLTNTARNVNVTADGPAVLQDSMLNIEVTWPDKKPYGDRVLEGNIISFQKVLLP
jgi:hypothetical protein